MSNQRTVCFRRLNLKGKLLPNVVSTHAFMYPESRNIIAVVSDIGPLEIEQGSKKNSIDALSGQSNTHRIARTTIYLQCSGLFPALTGRYVRLKDNVSSNYTHEDSKPHLNTAGAPLKSFYTHSNGVHA